jgi:hypothetical protein
MAFVTVESAADHLRADANDPRIPQLLAAAERLAIETLDCNVYATQSALNTAISAAPATLATAKAVFDAAMTAAALLTDEALREPAEDAAARRWLDALAEHDRTQAGKLVNDTIKTAILLLVQHMYEGGDTDKSAIALLWPDRRVGL